jgi:hypothetical protein
VTTRRQAESPNLRAFVRDTDSARADKPALLFDRVPFHPVVSGRLAPAPSQLAALVCFAAAF